MKPKIKNLKLDDDGDYKFELWVEYDTTLGDPHNRTVIWGMNAYPTGPRFQRLGLLIGAPHLIQGDWPTVNLELWRSTPPSMCGKIHGWAPHLNGYPSNGLNTNTAVGTAPNHWGH